MDKRLMMKVSSQQQRVLFCEKCMTEHVFKYSHIRQGKSGKRFAVYVGDGCFTQFLVQIDSGE